MKPDLERGELQYQPFTVWERIKRFIRNVDGAIWMWRYGRK